MTAADLARLARLAIETLDAQRVYYRAARDGAATIQDRVNALEKSKALERRLRAEAEACLDSRGRLFGDEGP